MTPEQVAPLLNVFGETFFYIVASGWQMHACKQDGMHLAICRSGSSMNKTFTGSKDIVCPCKGSLAER